MLIMQRKEDDQVPVQSVINEWMTRTLSSCFSHLQLVWIKTSFFGCSFSLDLTEQRRVKLPVRNQRVINPDESVNNPSRSCWTG